MKLPLNNMYNELGSEWRGLHSVCVYFEQNCRSLKSQNLRIKREFKGHLVKSSLKYLLASEKTQFLLK